MPAALYGLVGGNFFKEVHMRKLIIAFILSIGTLNVYGQFEFGAKIGGNLNNFKLKGLPEDQSIDKKISIGYHFGVYAQFRLNEKLFFVPEFQLILKGDKTESLRTNLYYLELPLLLQLKIAEPLRIELGGNLSYEIYAVDKRDDSKSKIDDSFDDFDISLLIGAGYQLMDRLMLSIRYSHSIKSIGQAIIPSGPVDFYNRNFLFGIRYNFSKLKTTSNKH